MTGNQCLEVNANMIKTFSLFLVEGYQRKECIHSKANILENAEKNIKKYKSGIRLPSEKDRVNG